MDGLTRGLGKWAAIDIETTGIDAHFDQIIDVGYLQFEGTQLIKKYSSLVRPKDIELSQFIQKLTGINSKQLKNAPSWDEVKWDVLDLKGHHLIAHNAGFERGFLKDTFDEVEGDSESYEDSLLFLGLLNPGKSSLKLENFIRELGLAEKEMHRGFEDSLDLIKVLLVTAAKFKRDREKSLHLAELFKRYDLHHYWYAKFLALDHFEIQMIADQIDFEIDSYLEESLDEDAIDVTASAKRRALEFSGENIKSILRDEEDLKKILPQYKHRDSQETLSLRTGQAFKNNVHALVQAPTGTGKTLGYLIPSALYSMQEGPVLVATGTKTLQHQVLKKDAPILRSILGIKDEELQIKRLVGSNNHLCELIFRQEEDDLLQSKKEFEDKIGEIYFEMVFQENSKRNTSEQIIRTDLPYIFKSLIPTFKERDQQLAVDFRACTGRRCPYKGECSYVQGLWEAKDAHIIIGNHALMYSWPKGLPRPQAIVVDEAHRLEDETTKAFSHEVSTLSLIQLAKNFKNMQGVGSLFYLLAQKENSPGESTSIIKQLRDEVLQAVSILEDHTEPMLAAAELYFKSRPRYTDQFWNELPMVEKNERDPKALSIRHHLESIQFTLHSLYENLLPHASRFDINTFKEENEIIAWTRWEAFFTGLSDLTESLKFCLQGSGYQCRSMAFHERDGFLAKSAPVNIGKSIHDHLLQTASSVIFTSATLGNAQGDRGIRGIEWATGYSYLEPEKRFKGGFFLPAAFDYKNNTKVFLCDDVLPIYDDFFVNTTLKKVFPLVESLGGRSLFLFSARKRFEAARELLIEKYDGHIPVFVQGMGSDVVEEFKNSSSGILLGMESFGEGIDIPGETLQFVFVDKIPDLRMDLVIKERRQFYQTELGNEFSDYYLAHRARALHQKLGRLIRRESDYGGILVVDSRIKKWKGSTMGQFQKLMEPYQIERTSVEEAVVGIEEFILARNSVVHNKTNLDQDCLST